MRKSKTISILISVFMSVICLNVLLFGTSNKNGITKDKKEYLDKYTLKQNRTHLKHVKSFPDENQIDNDIYLRNTLSFSVDRKNSLIYVCDNDDHKILVFDLMGKFVSQIGRKGQGPGDLFRPMTVMIWNDQIVVNDVGNLRIQFLKRNGDYIKSFKTFKTYYSMVIDKKGIIYGLHVNKYDGPHLIDVLSNDGKRLASFGKTHELLKKKDSLLENTLSLDHDEHIYLGDRSLGIMKKYSKEGTLIKEIELKYPPILDAKDFNIEQMKVKGQKSYYCFSDSWVEDNKLFVVRSGPVFEVIQFDMDGKVKRLFWNTDVTMAYVYDFSVLNKNNKYIFYTCHILPDRQVDIFTIDE